MPPDAKAYDLVVIGGGPAGIIGAVTAAALGAKRQPDLEGAGANTDTIPSKTLRETALGSDARLVSARRRLERHSHFIGPSFSCNPNATMFEPAAIAT